MKKYTVLIIGIVLFIASFIWMILSQSSTGPFLLLASVSGALIFEGVQRVKRNNK